jgi:hypothetical protein
VPGVFETDNQEGAHDHLNLGCCRLELPSSEEQAAEDA